MKLVIPFKLILIVLGILAVAVIIFKFTSSQNSIPFLSGDDSLVKTVQQDMRIEFDQGTDPYKEIKIIVIKNDGTRARVRAELTKQGDCQVYEVNEQKKYDEDESYSNDIEKGFLDFTKQDIYLFEAMGIIRIHNYGSYDSYQSYSSEKDKWKRCYYLADYVNVSGIWKNSGNFKDTPLLMAAKEQEKIGYQLTDRMVTEAVLKLTPTAKPEPTIYISESPDELKVAADDPVLGPSKAEVTVISFQDFQCPFCGAFNGFETPASKMLKEKDSGWQATLPNLKKEYIETGKVAYVWKDNPILGDESKWAAEAARCAQDQGKFWEFHDYLFSHQKEKKQSAFSKDNLKMAAAELKLNSSEFGKCLDSDKYEKKIEAAASLVQALQINGTPTTFINGQLLPGAYSYSTVKELIEKELK